MNIDWSKAPEGATHYQLESKYPFRDYSEDQAKYWNGTSWEWMLAESQTVLAHVDHVPRPAAPAWNGEGLPPVGTVCELQDATEVRILAHTKRAGAPVAVYQCTDSESIEAYTASFFRPIRTPEQIAAEEREAYINRMVEVLHARMGHGSPFSVCEALYDEGLRFPEERS